MPRKQKIISIPIVTQSSELHDVENHLRTCTETNNYINNYMLNMKQQMRAHISTITRHVCQMRWEFNHSLHTDIVNPKQLRMEHRIVQGCINEFARKSHIVIGQVGALVFMVLNLGMDWARALGLVSRHPSTDISAYDDPCGVLRRVEKESSKNGDYKGHGEKRRGGTDVSSSDKSASPVRVTSRSPQRGRKVIDMPFMFLAAICNTVMLMTMVLTMMLMIVTWRP